MPQLIIFLNKEQNEYVEYAANVLQVSKVDVVQSMIDECVTSNKKITEVANKVKAWEKEQGEKK